MNLDSLIPGIPLSNLMSEVIEVEKETSEGNFHNV